MSLINPLGIEKRRPLRLSQTCSPYEKGCVSLLTHMHGQFPPKTDGTTYVPLGQVEATKPKKIIVDRSMVFNITGDELLLNIFCCLEQEE